MNRKMLHQPHESDWSNPSRDFDIQAASKTFRGKSLAEAQAIFQSSALYYQEELSAMPTVCFQYYLVAYLDYLSSQASCGDSDGASCLFAMIGLRIQEFANNEELRKLVCESLAEIAIRQDWYEAPEYIYGSFPKKASELIQQLNAKK